jgi:hypothetical protein
VVVDIFNAITQHFPGNSKENYEELYKIAALTVEERIQIIREYEVGMITNRSSFNQWRQYTKL